MVKYYGEVQITLVTLNILSNLSDLITLFLPRNGEKEFFHCHGLFLSPFLILTSKLLSLQNLIKSHVYL